MGKKQKESASIPSLEVYFSDHKEKQCIGEELNIKAVDIGNSIYKNIPDFEGEDDCKSEPHLSGLNAFNSMERVNNNYYRKLFLHHYVDQKINNINFCIVNNSTILAKGLHLLLVLEKSKDYVVIKEEDIPKRIQKYYDLIPRALHNTVSSQKISSPLLLDIEETNNEWHIKINVGKVYANTTTYVDEKIIILSNKSHATKISTILYGDNVPHPVKKELTVFGTVSHKNLTLEDVIDIDNLRE